MLSSAQRVQPHDARTRMADAAGVGGGGDGDDGVGSQLIAAAAAVNVEPTAKDKVMADELLTAVRRDINCLADNSKMTRKRAVINLRKATVDAKVKPEVLQILLEAMLKPLIKLFADPAEKVRELSIGLITEISKTVTTVITMLPYVVPAIVTRIGAAHVEEDSEEVRLLLVTLISVLVVQGKKAVALYMDEFIQVLVKGVVDPFPDVKKACCECVVSIAETIPERFHMGSKPLHKPLIITLGFNHSKVRMKAIRAIEALCLHGENTAINDFMVPLAQKTMDSSPGVRKALYTAVGSWMLDLKDRYSFWYKLLTLMLNGVHDEVPEIRKLCVEKFHAGGRQWEKENEEEIKDLVDFGLPEDSDRPPLGCRILVEREFSKILPGLMKDICDWTVEIRLQSAGLLKTLLEYCEAKATMHFEKTLGCLLKAVRDEDDRIASLVVDCAEICGKHTDAKMWYDMIVPRLSSAGLTVSEQVAYLIVVGALLRGSDKAKTADHLTGIMKATSSENVSGVQNMESIDELFLLVRDALDTADQADAMSAELSYNTFLTMINALAMSGGRAKADFDENMATLARLMKIEVADVYAEHMATVLDELAASHATWNKYTFERTIFETVLTLGGGALGDSLDIIMEVFYVNFDPEKDPEMRLSFFALLARLLGNSAAGLNSTGKFKYAEEVILKIVVPNCIWKNGRIPAAIRTSTCLCMWALLQSGMATQADLSSSLPTLLPQMVACMDDDYEETRHTVCNVIEQLLVVCKDAFTQDTTGYDKLHSLYLELLKRLDDNSDAIRLAALKAWLALAKCMTHRPYDRSLYRAHSEAIFKGLLIHLDDTNESIQMAVHGVLQEFGPVNPDLMKMQINEARPKHRTPAFCDALLKTLP